MSDDADVRRRAFEEANRKALEDALREEAARAKDKTRANALQQEADRQQQISRNTTANYSVCPRCGKRTG